MVVLCSGISLKQLDGLFPYVIYLHISMCISLDVANFLATNLGIDEYRLTAGRPSCMLSVFG